MARKNCAGQASFNVTGASGAEAKVTCALTAAMTRTAFLPTLSPHRRWSSTGRRAEAEVVVEALARCGDIKYAGVSEMSFAMRVRGMLQLVLSEARTRRWSRRSSAAAAPTAARARRSAARAARGGRREGGADDAKATGGVLAQDGPQRDASRTGRLRAQPHSSHPAPPPSTGLKDLHGSRCGRPSRTTSCRRPSPSCMRRRRRRRRRLFSRARAPRRPLLPRLAPRPLTSAPLPLRHQSIFLYYCGCSIAGSESIGAATTIGMMEFLQVRAATATTTTTATATATTATATTTTSTTTARSTPLLPRPRAFSSSRTRRSATSDFKVDEATRHFSAANATRRDGGVALRRAPRRPKQAEGGVGAESTRPRRLPGQEAGRLAGEGAAREAEGRQGLDALRVRQLPRPPGVLAAQPAARLEDNKRELTPVPRCVSMLLNDCALRNAKRDTSAEFKKVLADGARSIPVT